MQTAGGKNMSTMDNLIIMSTIIEKQRLDHKNTYILCADEEKCFKRQFDKSSV